MKPTGFNLATGLKGTQSSEPVTKLQTTEIKEPWKTSEETTTLIRQEERVTKWHTSNRYTIIME
jgi:hypothetical protein